MKNKILNITLIAGIIIVVLFLGTMFRDYNLNKTISACIVSQKLASNSFEFEKAKKICEENIRKKTKSSK
tara:strand:+ start:497 stop:706 length:210 start_codon:yes stop_codon:yes gene_type:complete